MADQETNIAALNNEPNEQVQRPKTFDCNRLIEAETEELDPTEKKSEKPKSKGPNVPPSSPEQLFVTEKQLAARWQSSVKKLQKDRLHGTGPPFVRMGRLVRYRMTDVVDYEAEHTLHHTSGKLPPKLSKEESSDVKRSSQTR